MDGKITVIRLCLQDLKERATEGAFRSGAFSSLAHHTKKKY